MAGVIERIDPGLPEATRILTEFMFYARKEIIEKQKNRYFNDDRHGWKDDIKPPSKKNTESIEGIDQKLNVKDLDFLQLSYLWGNNKSLIENETSISPLAINYLYELGTIRGKGHHPTAAIDYASDSDFVARALDTLRRFIILLLPYVNLHRKVDDEIFPPEFKYSINHPQDSMVIVSPVPGVKTKTTENVLVRRAPYDFSKAKYDVNRNSILKIIKDFNCLKKNESAMVVRTNGDVFQYFMDGKGYTGDWEKDVEVSKIFIIHFFEGKASRNAYMYVADYSERFKENNYTPKRFRYYFTNIQYCGSISADFDRDFKSCQVVRYEDLG